MISVNARLLVFNEQCNFAFTNASMPTHSVCLDQARRCVQQHLPNVIGSCSAWVSAWRRRHAKPWREKANRIQRRQYHSRVDDDPFGRTNGNESVLLKTYRF